MLIINFKNYKTGNDVFELLRKIELYYPKAIAALPFTELKEANKLKSSHNLQIFSQHVDYEEPGRGTGYVTPEALLGCGVSGSLLNHSEHKIPMTTIRKTAKRCNEAGIKLIICSSSLKEIKQLIRLNPWAIAFEDKKLVATGKSITSMKANDVKKFADSLKDTGIIPVCGAGISSGEDVADAFVLGCKGVLVSSVVASSQEPEKFLKEVSGLM